MGFVVVVIILYFIAHVIIFLDPASSYGVNERTQQALLLALSVGL